MCMTAGITMPVWSQKPQTSFSDLRHQRKTYGNTRVMVPPVQRDVHSKSKDTPTKYRPEADNAWTCTSFVNLGYAMDQTLKIGGTNYGYESKWGATLQVGNSYMWPKEALFDMLKIGLDATWFDLSGAQYEDARYDCYHVTAGMGVGASVHIAPLVHVSEVLSPLRIEGYCRFVPSYSLFLRHTTDEYEDDYGEIVSVSDTKARGAFLPVVSCGFALDYRAIGIGYEHRFGNADYKDLVDDGAKTRYDMTSNRVYISFRM